MNPPPFLRCARVLQSPLLSALQTGIVVHHTCKHGSVDSPVLWGTWPYCAWYDLREGRGHMVRLAGVDTWARGALLSPPNVEPDLGPGDHGHVAVQRHMGVHGRMLQLGIL